MGISTSKRSVDITKSPKKTIEPIDGNVESVDVKGGIVVTLGTPDKHANGDATPETPVIETPQTDIKTTTDEEKSPEKEQEKEANEKDAKKKEKKEKAKKKNRSFRSLSFLRRKDKAKDESQKNGDVKKDVEETNEKENAKDTPSNEEASTKTESDDATKDATTEELPAKEAVAAVQNVTEPSSDTPAGDVTPVVEKDTQDHDAEKPEIEADNEEEVKESTFVVNTSEIVEAALTKVEEHAIPEAVTEVEVKTSEIVTPHSPEEDKSAPCEAPPPVPATDHEE